PVALQYLTLFRPAKSALSWKKALRIIKELAVLIGSGSVQIEGKVSRPCPARIWAAAIDEMLVNPGIKRPLKNHNYLRQVAWGMADNEDAAAETRQSREQPQAPYHARTRDPISAYIEGRTSVKPGEE
ncbi:hypothetical protein ACFL6N_07630, partial [Thermodesulfobacteriota bacterium]